MGRVCHRPRLFSPPPQQPRPPSSGTALHTPVDFLLTASNLFLCCDSSLRMIFFILSLFNSRLSFCASGGRCFVIVALPGILHLYFLL